jgi:methanogenic corrinoid protein MtbC1
MASHIDLSAYDDKPLYNTRAVVHATGIPASTLRAWERRYHILSPHRTSKAYRLYSERDIATIRWLNQQLATGLTISQAAALLTAQQGSALADQRGGLFAPSGQPAPADLPRLVQRLYRAFLDFDEQEAEAITSLALAYYPVDVVCLDLLAETEAEIGNGWHRGDVPVTAEHFGSNFVRTRLISLLQLQPSNASGPLVIVACAPNEQHELGALLVALFLRWRGFRIIYLGQNVPAIALLDTIRTLQPAMVCMSATSEANAHHLSDFSHQLAQLAHPPIFGFGGGAYNRMPELREAVAGHFLGESARAVPALATALLHDKTPAPNLG